MPTLTAENLVKHYGRFPALENTRLTLETGRVTGFIGPNGAGKTTTIKSILGLVHPDKGRILLDGRNILGDHRARKHFAYAPEVPEAPLWITACNLLETLAMIEGISRFETRRLARQALEKMGVETLCDRPLSKTSKGQRKRILLAQALLLEKDFYLLDEPVSGLDPEWVAEVRNIISKLARGGAGVLVSSHLLRELETVVDRVTVINAGRTIFEGSPEELAAKAGVKPIVSIIIATGDPGRAAYQLRTHGYAARDLGRNVIVELKDFWEAHKVASLVEELGFRVEAYEARRGSLEEAYLQLIRGRR
ncbi:MAG: ABC transporter ATP-binding protein [Desulfurococcales archaeon]|nr:ABC transporter ATP-binding protein [Desulfurococcales archaeon]